MLSDSRGWPGFKSRPGRNLKTCNFEGLEVAAMYFTFSETSNLFLYVWTKENKSIAVCSVYNMLSGIPISLLHISSIDYFQNLMTADVFISTCEDEC